MTLFINIFLQGGKFFFMEHVCADENTWTYILQKLMSLPWYYMSGCRLTQKPWIDIKRADFSQVEYEKIYVPFKFGLSSLVAPHVTGKATK